MVLLSAVTGCGLSFKPYPQSSAHPVPVKTQPAATLRDIQQALKERGYAVRVVDGIDGPRTRRALRNFQADYGLTITGTPTLQTQQALGL